MAAIQSALPKMQRPFRRMAVKVDPTVYGGTGTAVWYVLGRDNDDLTREKSYDENDQLNVLGEFTSTNKLSGESITNDPFYARKGDVMSLLLYHFDSTNADLDDIKVQYGEVVVDLDTEEVVYAFTQDAYVLLQSVGGPSSDADSMPFNLKLVGTKQEAEYDLATGAFTAK